MLRSRRVRRREERREDRRLGTRRGAGTRYKMRQRMLSIGDDFWIENEEGQNVFRVDGKALRLRKTLKIEDVDGNVLCTVRERKLPIRGTMEVEGPHGERLARVSKALVDPLRSRWVVNIADGPDLRIRGNILNHEYQIGEGSDKVAEVSKEWFRVRDSYGVAIDPGQNDALILAITVAIDQMAHAGR